VGRYPPAVNEIARTVPERLKVVREGKVSAWAARLARCASGLARSPSRRAGLDMGGRPEEGRSQQRFVLIVRQHPPLETGATRAVDPEQEAGPGWGLHVASQNAAPLVGLDEPAELMIDAQSLRLLLSHAAPTRFRLPRGDFVPLLSEAAAGQWRQILVPIRALLV
jgi:hypothetical protein